MSEAGQGVETVPDGVSESLVEEASERFGVGLQYARAYLEYWQWARQQVYGSLAEILESEAPYPMWFEFAMSTNERADRFRDFLLSVVGEPKGRYLDVGCGFGGYLRAFADAGMDVTGIEIDTDRIDLSRANARDGDLGECVQHLDVLAPDAVERLGRFDLITCIDVIEHVLDVPMALRRMSELLEPGGVLCLEIPNKDSIDFVGSDGHFNLFGITQLSREDSIRYHGVFFQFDYDVGYYFPSRYYVDRLAESSMTGEYVDYPSHPTREIRETWRQLRGLGFRYLGYRRGPRRKTPFGLNAKLHWVLLRYGTRLMFDRAMALLPGRRSRFRSKYLANFWLLIARKQ